MKYIRTALLMGALTLTGCTTMKSAEFDVNIKSSNQVQITNVSVHRDDGLLHVTGTLRPASTAIMRTGHVDVEFIGEQGEVLQTAHANATAQSFSRNSTRRPSFSVKVDLDDVAGVRLTHHPDTMNVSGH